ncbi:D-alanyl-D-alanine carboxypeptidase family protein [Candidatus Puniceispirillum marinum]|uniref:serine-type D-Ala-D-Ala carboxypeptidase n=1 Tax=Puniceispirillum marinum (strain IMCC1322) TaxID=488538 RepID=D5BQA0_PUNMI|nr:D-alanyl-D-alanine carboxypeptidase family protein [Candidatus Puniceispirillum marinum]ADE38598.1 D-alanyl-D-alanine carboxypeptidase [Candidatus Puniceispirillum marinum IMCC1322]
MLKRLLQVTTMSVFISASWLTISNSAGSTEITTPAEFAYITDFDTGKVLFQKNADMQMKPASMAKIMTIFIAFERIREGGLSLNDKFQVSEKAWRKGGSRSFLEVGSFVTVSDLLNGVIVQSGNDAAIVIAEGISGTEESFAEEMNFWAQKLGMENTVFRNSTGWPDPELTTTAKDLNILSSALISRFPIDEYPDLYPMFKKKRFEYNGIDQPNRNPLVYGTVGADGLKTGHTKESGYGVVGSAIREGQRVVMVLNGMTSMKQRSAESRRLMDLAFREFKQYRFFEANETVDVANVWLGKMPSVDLVLANPLHRVLSRDERRHLKMSVNWVDPVSAPITKGQKLGVLTIEGKSSSETIDLLAANDVEELGVFDRIGAAFKYLIFGAGAGTNAAN